MHQTMTTANSNRTCSRRRRIKIVNSNDDHYCEDRSCRRPRQQRPEITRMTAATLFRRNVFSSKTVSLQMLLLLLLLAVVNAENNLRRSENVFGWQKKKASSLPPIQQQQQSLSSSPLRRAENVFGWQNKSSSVPQRRKNINGNNGRNDNKRRKSIINISNNNGGGSRHYYSNNDDNEKDYSDNDIIKIRNTSTPNMNIKLSPRKKELWLPWPLGSLRNDFHRFAHEHRTNNNSGNNNDEQQHLMLSSPQQRRLRNYYSDDYNDDEVTQPNIFNQGKEWASRMFQRGENMFRGNNSLDESSEVVAEQQSGYWIKDTTTPMATASATMSKNKDSKNSGSGGKNSRRFRGGKGEETTSTTSSSDRDVLFQYIKLQASIRMRQLGYVGSDFSVHLPPASPTLLLLYLLPAKQDPLRRLVKFTMSTAAISWMHSEATKYRRLAPLPIMKGCNVREPNLPPFLPEERPVLLEEVDEKKLGNDGKDKGSGSGSSSSSSKAKGAKEKEGPKVAATRGSSDDDDSSSTQGWDLKSFGTISSAYRTWLEGYNSRNQQSYHQRRKRTQETLLALRNSSNSTKSATDANTGYALVTGASRGIGRAIAVELARYNIPLILVARDVSKLSAVAKDIETHYGIPCRILQADLTSPDCASRIHAATTKAGLDVDILINNAGVCTHGELIEGDIDDAFRMIQVNVGSVVELSRLYGKNMKDRRRGRILFVSSMSGALPGCPSVAVYAATKSFEKSLASSLGRELERYGVGVTCLLPGAVKDTAFASSSEIEDAACFHFPGYAKTPELVASEGIKGLMLGYPEVYPGWQNRLFVKMGLPMLPSRVSNIIGEWAWNPWQWGDVIPHRSGTMIQKGSVENDSTSSTSIPSSSASSLTWKFRRSSSNQMQLPDAPKESKKDVSEIKLPTQFVDPTASNLVPSDESLMDDESQSSDGNQAIPPPREAASEDTNNEPTKSSVAKVTNDEENKNEDKPTVNDGQTPSHESEESTNPESSTVSHKKEDAFFITGDSPSTEPPVLPLPPSTPKASSQPSPPLFGFFDKDKDSISTSPDGNSLEKVSTDTEESNTQVSPEDKVTVETFPSMLDNQRGYDFRDRRLDYTK